MWGTRVSPGTISNLNKKIYEGILRNGETFLIKNHYSYVYLDGIWMQVKNVSVLVATMLKAIHAKGNMEEAAK